MIKSKLLLGGDSVLKMLGLPTVSLRAEVYHSTATHGYQEGTTTKDNDDVTPQYVEAKISCQAHNGIPDFLIGKIC